MKRWFALVLPVLICLISSNAFAAAESDQIIVDGFGWRASAVRKVAMMSKPITGYNNSVTFTLPANGAAFQIKNASDNSTAFSGTLTQFNSGATNTQSGDQVCWADFSAFTTPGTYYLYDPTNNVQSYNFQLNDNIFNNVLTTAGRFFFYQRCGCDITPANGGNWNHAACHEQDTTAHLWNGGADKGAPKDVHGGWHDAGDFNKYVPFTLDAVFALMMAYELNPTAFGDNWNIPESGNGVPDMLDEIKWELDWMIRMQNADGSVCNRVGVLNYVTAYPQNDNQARYYTQATTWATSTFAGLAAHGARLFAAYNTQYPGYSAALLTAAQNAWAYLLTNTSMTPASGQDGGGTNGGGTNFAAADGSSTVDDDARRRLFAAAEIYKSTGLASAKTYFETNYNSAATADAGNGNQQPITSGYFDPSASWTTNEALVVYASVTGYATTAAVVTAIKNSLKAGIENTVTANYSAKTDPYRAYMFDGHYCWGSNQIKAQWAALTLFGLYLNVNPANAALYKETAEEYLHYFHGRNPLSYIYLTNMGAKGANLTTGKSCMQIYHGWFYAGSPLYDGASSTYGQAPGMLAGGPNQYFDVASIIPPSGQPPQKSFKDFNIGWDGTKNEDSWEVSEPGIYYQAKYLMVLAYFAGPAGTPTPTQTATNYAGSPTFTPTVTITNTITLTPTLTSTPAVVILNTCDTMLYNGTWSGANAARSINANASYISQGTGSLQVAISTTVSWNDGIAKCTGFVPTNWSNAASVTLDVYIDPLSAPWLAGSSYHQLDMYVDSAPNKYYRQVSTGQNLTTGWNHITFTINWALDIAAHTTDTDPSPILATDPITSYFFIFNSDIANLSAGTMYLDNINLVSLGGNTPTFTPTLTYTATGTPASSFTFTFTRTATPSATATPTGSKTYTATSSATLTNTMQISFTATYTPTKTMTYTATQTSTQYAGTPTITETSTACACATYAGNTTTGTAGEFSDYSVVDTNRITMKQDGVVTALEMYVVSESGGRISMALYSDNGGAPGTLIAESAAQTAVVGWNVVNVASTMVPAGTYWVAWQMDSDVVITADVGVTGDDQWLTQSFGAFPASMAGASSFYLIITSKVDYCPLTCNTITPTPTPTAIPECMCAAQFGMQYEGSSGLGPINGFSTATWYGMSEDGIATSMEVYITQGSGNARLALYTNSVTTTANAQPDELICESQPFAVTVGWNTVAIPQVFLAANTVYWLTFECDDPSIYVAADNGNAGDVYYREQAFGDFDAEFTNATSAAFDDSILVNYCPLSCPPTPTVTETVSETVTETPSMAATKTMTMTPTNMINSPTVTATVSVTQTYTYTQTFTATATEQVSPSNTPVTPVNTATQSPTQQATATYTTTPQASATATATPGGAATATATMTAGVVPIPYPNPAKPGTDDIKMNVTVEKAASEIKFLMFTPGYRLVREKSLGSYPQGIMQVDLDKADFKGMANSVYYFIIDKKYSDGTSAVTKPGKIILIN